VLGTSSLVEQEFCSDIDVGIFRIEEYTPNGITDVRTPWFPGRHYRVTPLLQAVSKQMDLSGFAAPLYALKGDKGFHSDYAPLECVQPV
jgi:hypothetical protein